MSHVLAMDERQERHEGHLEPEALSVLVLEDDPADRRMIKRTMSQVRGFEIDLTFAETMEAARHAVRDKSFDVVFVDYYLDEGCGPDLVPELIDGHPHCAAILLTGQLIPSTHHHAILNGVTASVSKYKLDAWHLETTMRHAILERYRLANFKARTADAEATARTLATSNRHPAISAYIQSALEEILEKTEAMERSVVDGNAETNLPRRARQLRFVADDLMNFFADCDVVVAPNTSTSAVPAVCDLQSVLLDATNFLHPGCGQRQVRIEVDYAEAPLMVQVHESLLRRSLTDILAACLQRVPRGGRLLIDLASQEDGGTVSMVLRADQPATDTVVFDAEFADLIARGMCLLEPAGAELSLSSDAGVESDIASITIPAAAVSSARSGRAKCHHEAPVNERQTLFTADASPQVPV